MVGDKEVGDLPTIADDLVVTKYKMAAEIVNSKSEDYHPKPFHTNLTAVVASPNVCHAIISCLCHPPFTWATKSTWSILILCFHPRGSQGDL